MFLRKLSHAPVDAESLLRSAVNRSSCISELSGTLVEEELECITVEHLYDDHVMFMEAWSSFSLWWVRGLYIYYVLYIYVLIIFLYTYYISMYLLYVHVLAIYLMYLLT